MLKLENVSKVYRTAEVETHALDNVSFDIPSGRFSAIVGPSGVGKSTIADLMVRLLDPDSGVVMIDGIDVKNLALHDLRKTIVLIDQSPYLFHGTVF